MKIQIENIKGGKSEIFDLSDLTLKDIEVLLKYVKTVKITKID